MERSAAALAHRRQPAVQRVDSADHPVAGRHVAASRGVEAWPRSADADVSEGGGRTHRGAAAEAAAMSVVGDMPVPLRRSAPFHGRRQVVCARAGRRRRHRSVCSARRARHTRSVSTGGKAGAARLSVSPKDV